jgi:hypothetical protein
MKYTGNSGPEGITFVPDSALSAINFISQDSNLPYVSKKGMNGLIFIAHQDGGFVWVFDINPNVSNDFLFVGKYKTSRDESCDLAFDKSTGMLYILHNTGSNYLEVTDLSTSDISDNVKKFNQKTEYFLPNPSTNINIEGFALANKCPETNMMGAWLCRDASSSDASSIKTDVLRWFSPFEAFGDCNSLSIEKSTFVNDFLAYPNPTNGNITIALGQFYESVTLKLTNNLGQLVFTNSYKKTNEIKININLNLNSGIYFAELKAGKNKKSTIKIIKK